MAAHDSTWHQVTAHYSTWQHTTAHDIKWQHVTASDIRGQQVIAHDTLHQKCDMRQRHLSWDIYLQYIVPIWYMNQLPSKPYMYGTGVCQKNCCVTTVIACKKVCKCLTNKSNIYRTVVYTVGMGLGRMKGNTERLMIKYQSRRPTRLFLLRVYRASNHFPIEKDITQRVRVRYTDTGIGRRIQIETPFLIIKKQMKV